MNWSENLTGAIKLWGSCMMAVLGMLALLWTWFSLAPQLLSMHIFGYLVITVVVVLLLTIVCGYIISFFTKIFIKELNAKR